MVTRLEKNSLLPDLKTYLFSRMLQLPASKFGSPDLELLVSDLTVNKVVQQIGGGGGGGGGGGLPSPFSLELLVDGLSITLLLIPIDRSPDEITFYGTNS